MKIKLRLSNAKKDQLVEELSSMGEFAKAEGEAYKADKGEFPSFTEYALSSGSAIITIE